MNPNKFCKAGNVECKWYHVIMGFKIRHPLCESLHMFCEDFERCPVPSKIETPKEAA